MSDVSRRRARDSHLAKAHYAREHALRFAGIRGRLILSINDTPGAREVFGRFAIEAVETTYTISMTTAGGGKRSGELIVSR